MGSHSSTRGYTSWKHSSFWPSDPFCGGKGVHHFVTVVQHSKVLVPFFCHQEIALDPVHHLSNVSTGMNIAVRSIPENEQKPTPCTLFPLEIVAKLNDVILKSVQLRISGANNSDVGELGYSCTARQDQGPFLHACRASSTTEGISLQGELLRCERQPQHSECCTAAWGGHRIPTPADGFLAQLLQDRNTHAGQLKGLPSTFMEHLTDPCNLGNMVRRKGFIKWQTPSRNAKSSFEGANPTPPSPMQQCGARLPERRSYHVLWGALGLRVTKLYF